ncbi:DinB family protein [Actinocrispum sp. NPDC049592]|uniref:DinB family protein n=1 Tax=Actinocrispum sp. NPDC049592 TaxID=3154835 RepID=UPI00344A9AC9
MEDGERGALLHFLQAQRDVVFAILVGLDDAALTTKVLPSGWTPLGLVEHLGYAERHWFQEVLLGSADPVPWADDDHTPLNTARSRDEVFAFYRSQCARSNDIFAAHSLTTPVRSPDHDLGPDFTDLRRIVLHMIEETARHAGHLDAARELLDGTTGLGPR